MWACCRRAFFDARPVGGQPRGNRLRVALARNPPGLLRGEPAVAKPDGHILRVEVDTELLADHVGHPRPGPQVGREPVVGRLVCQPPADELLLGAGQLRRPARRRPGDQTRPTRLSIRGDPAPHRAGIDAEELGDLLGRVPLQDALDGKEATMFQFRRRALVSHARKCKKTVAARTLLF